jgi:hypothetical protein
MPIADRMGGQSLDFNNDELHRTNVINLQLSTVTEFGQSNARVVAPVSTSTYGEQMLRNTHTRYRRTHRYRHTYVHTHRVRIVT